MNLVLLSGGSGKRLWPLSNDVRSKQFIPFFKTPDGGRESMVQRVFRQIRKIDGDARVTIATSESQVPAIKSQLGEAVGISVEPCRRDTFPAIALASAYLHDVQGVGEEESVVVCPVDPYVDDDYFAALKKLGELAADGLSSLVLMGIEPTCPSEKYGYIIPEGEAAVSRVRAFKEKPDRRTAEDYIRQGALWNGGVFAYRLGYVLERAREQIGFCGYRELFEKYGTLPKISFDYAVVEKEPDIRVMRFGGGWKDLGTWDALTETLPETCIGDGRLNESCENVHVINELGLPVICMGLRDIVVAASPEGILVADKGQADGIKSCVDQLNRPVMFAEEAWGSYRVLDVCPDGMLRRLTLKPGCTMDGQGYIGKDVVWTVLSGKGSCVADGEERAIAAGDTVSVRPGVPRSLRADTPLSVYEVLRDVPDGK